MRLVIATPFLETKGGMERVVLKIAQHFKAKIHCFSYEPGATFEEFRSLEIETAKPGALSKIPFGKRVTSAIEAGSHFYNVKLSDYDLINAHQTPSEWIRNKNSPVLWYCLHEDTPVMKICAGVYHFCAMKDIRVGDELFSFDERMGSSTGKVVKLMKRKARNLHILRLMNGREIIATMEHTFFILKDGAIAVSQLSELKAGDLIPIPKSIKTHPKKNTTINAAEVIGNAYSNHPHWASRLFINFKGDSIAIGNRKTVLMPAKIKISKEFMRILGYFASEGYIHCRHKQRREDMQLGFSFGSHEEHTLVKDCVRCIRTVFGVEPLVKKPHNKKEILVILPNVFALFMLSLGCGSKARGKRVPDVVFNSGPVLQKEFLKAYVDGDGYHEKKTERHSLHQRRN